MRFKYIFILLATAGFLFSSCGDESTSSEGETSDNSEETTTETPKETSSQLKFEKNGLTVTAMEDSPEYADATLDLVSPEPGVDLESGSNQFSFSVGNYELGAQTPTAADRGLANSGKGQHIHLIINNGPYSAHYDGEFEKEMEDGHYVLLAFLSRSYHESVKAPGAAVIRQFNVGIPENFKEVDLNAPHMFYSRPKGTYSGEDTKRLLLDFYLANVDLSPDGYKVNAKINGTEFTFTKWVPYVIEGLPLGEVTIELELVDGEGNTVESPFNPVTRTVTLEEAS